MNPASCSTHPERPALYACEECGRSLCGECVDEGHRLLFCRHCGERAVPLAAEAAATAPERQRAARRAAPWTMRDALVWPLAGEGKYLIGAYALVLALNRLPVIGCLGALVAFAALLLFPGLMLSAARSTADGDLSPPDWPDWMDTGARASEIVAFLFVWLVSLLPTLVLLRLGGCLEVSAWADGAAHCRLLVGLGMVLAAPQVLSGIAVVAYLASAGAALRIDLQLRLLIATAPLSLAMAGAVAGVVLVGQLVSALVIGLPLVGGALDGAVTAYSLLLIAHFAGLLLRRHPEAATAILGG